MPSVRSPFSDSAPGVAPQCTSASRAQTARRSPLRTVVAAAGAAALMMGLAACSGAEAAPAETAAADASASRVIEHGLGETTIEGTPETIVALEFSFVEALDGLGVSATGIADDDDPVRVEQLLGGKTEYTSVGTRAEPSLEIVASLAPDLIIADISRHGEIYDQLSEIAPTIALSSKEASYQEIKDSTIIIADALGDKAAGEQALADHEKAMDDYATELEGETLPTIMMAVPTEEDATLHASSSFDGSVFEALGFEHAMVSDEPLESGAGLERIIAINPGFLIVATDGPTVYDTWKTNPAWSSLTAVTNGSVFEVNQNEYSRFRGLATAEKMAKFIVDSIQGDK